MTTSTDEPTAPVAGPPEQGDSVGTLLSAYFAKIRGGDVGSLPAVLGLVALVIVFSVLRPDTFTTSLNFANLLNQSAGVMVLAMGLVFVLLLGEIDLSAGFTGGAAAAVMGVVMTNHHQNWFISVIACLATGAAIGIINGLLVARLGIPSFIVTLAGFLALQGVMLEVIGEGGTITFTNDVILKLNNSNLPVWAGWLLAVVSVGGYALVTFWTMVSRRRQGLLAQPTLLWLMKSAGLAIVVIAMVGYLSQERSRNAVLKSLKGVPIVVVVIVVLVVILTYMLNKTSWGRHVYAVGGNAEAARRAGINVAWIKISCFIMCSTLAAIAGILIASRDNSVSPQTGGQETLLFAVGAAVIGGTSLFGGKGRVTDAVIGGLVIAVIQNGMLLLNQPAGVVYIVTGGVLLLAAAVDALSRRRATATGRV